MALQLGITRSDSLTGPSQICIIDNHHLSSYEDAPGSNTDIGNPHIIEFSLSRSTLPSKPPRPRRCIASSVPTPPSPRPRLALHDYVFGCKPVFDYVFNFVQRPYRRPDWGGSLPESEWFLSAAQILWFNQSVNAAVYLGAMAWGLHTAIFYKAARAVWRGSHQSRVTWLPLIGTLWAMATINMACNVRFNELAFVDSSGYNGGPFAYVVAYQSSPVNVAAVSTAIVSLCLADVFLLYRVHVLWRKWYIAAPLHLLFLTALAFAILQAWAVGHGDSSFWVVPAFGGWSFYIILAMSLHCLLTILLLWGVLDLSCRLAASLTGHSRTIYTGYKAVLVESALPYGIISFVLMILTCVDSDAANLFVPLLVQLQGITVELIVIRIVNGYAWSLVSLRAINEKLITLRGQLGRRAGSENVSMEALGGNRTGGITVTTVAMSGPPPSVPSVLLPELTGFVPQFLLDDIINIANDATRQAVDAMEAFLERRDAARNEVMDDWKTTEELEKGLNAFQTLLESHVDIAFDFFEAWSLRNIFAIPADLPVVAPHQKGLDLDQPQEKETELLEEIKDLRRKIQAQRKLRRLFSRAVRSSNAQLAHSKARLEQLSFIRSPQLQELGSLADEFLAMYNAVSALPPIDPASTAIEQAPLPEPGKRPWETSKMGYFNWAVGQLMLRAKEHAKGEGDFGAGSSAVGAAAAAAYDVANVQDVKGALEAIAGQVVVAQLDCTQKSTYEIELNQYISLMTIRRKKSEKPVFSYFLQRIAPAHPIQVHQNDEPGHAFHTPERDRRGWSGMHRRTFNEWMNLFSSQW
ncbi:hypothetical protein IEO21_06574 [Rhodonia placenta]|uniref:Uncharacterized protein n=1 Tax=Rhodonia placenta TaxID=104341 RepID=A0A8H7P024_9APHY|nr:hypothetical protein IEO21_06574 [Postia placenta]